MKTLQYCSVCKAEFEMEVVPTADGDDDGVVWLQCPQCRGFLPKIRTSLAPEAPSAEPAADEAAGTESVDETAAEPASDKAPVAEPADPAPEADADADEAEAARQDEALAAMDVDKAVTYRPWSAYEEGDVVHHLAWNDFGVVVGKELLPGNRRVIQVRFAEHGTVRLIEQDGSGR